MALVSVPMNGKILKSLFAFIQPYSLLPQYSHATRQPSQSPLAAQGLIHNLVPTKKGRTKHDYEINEFDNNECVKEQIGLYV